MSSPVLAAFETLREGLLGLPGVSRREGRRLTSLYTVGDEARSIFLLETGLVKLWRPGHAAREILYDLVFPGELFGEQGVLEGGEYQGGAEMMQDGTVYEIPREVFQAYGERRPEMWRVLAELLSRRGGRLEMTLERVLTHDVRQRLLLSLAELAERMGLPENGSRYTIHLSQVEVANLVGATRETTSSTLNVLKRDGLIRLGRRRLTVSSPEALRLAAIAQCDAQAHRHQSLAL